MEQVCCILLAAGDGKRMKSAYPKVLSEVLFKPMVRWVADCAAAAGIREGCAVVGEQGELVRAVLPDHYASAVQAQRLGTGHAVKMAGDYLRRGGFAHVAVLCGDAPLIRPEDLRKAYDRHTRDGNVVTVLSAEVERPTGYGRIVRSGGRVIAIVEEADASPEQKAIKEINSGTYWFDAPFLLESLDSMDRSNAQGEYYLTDVILKAVEQDLPVGACRVSADSAEGANDRMGLMRLNELARKRVLLGHMEQGVNIPLWDGVLIGADVTIGADTTILPGSIVKGESKIGRNCEIGPNSHLDGAEVGDGCQVISSYIESSTLDEGVRLGPMSYVRPGCRVGPGAKIGDFVELKNSNIGAGTSVAHLTYVGDSDVGENCNFGCGVVTVNYDGKQKHRTVVGDGAFVGCNTNLVAPVRMGDRSYSAAGTTVTEDVPDGALVIGRARQAVKENWADQGQRYGKAYLKSAKGEQK